MTAKLYRKAGEIQCIL